MWSRSAFDSRRRARSGAPRIGTHPHPNPLPRGTAGEGTRRCNAMQRDATDLAIVQNEPTAGVVVPPGQEANDRARLVCGGAWWRVVKSHLGENAAAVQPGATPCNRVQRGATRTRDCAKRTHRSRFRNRVTSATTSAARRLPPGTRTGRLRRRSPARRRRHPRGGANWRAGRPA